MKIEFKQKEEHGVYYVTNDKVLIGQILMNPKKRWRFYPETHLVFDQVEMVAVANKLAELNI